MIKPENKNQMVRGYVVAGTRYNCIVAKDNPECAIAYTHWYRHDEDLTLLERETTKIQNIYMAFEKTSTVMVGYEYKDYRK